MLFILPRINLLDSLVIRSCVFPANIINGCCAFFCTIHTYREATVDDVLCSFWYVLFTVVAFSFSHGDHLPQIKCFHVSPDLILYITVVDTLYFSDISLTIFSSFSNFRLILMTSSADNLDEGFS